MHIVQYRQWPRQASRQEQFNRLFARFPRDAAANAGTDEQWVPRVDVREEAERFVILADLPGLDPAEIEISMDKGVLSIKGRREAVAVEEGSRYSRVERLHGDFNRSFALPEGADADGIVATGQNGVLEISIPRKAASTPRRIQVGAPVPPAA
ncbi:MAG: Hsp20/alpha crystallin family protein [Lysobacteraceae bacterium]|nr:MAG: Hsp20/alpha crystallin family protein [Xanthomonadaceae bacterium]